MKRSTAFFASAAVLALALTSLSTDAMAWGADGHRTVAAIAMKLLPPAKAKRIDNLLKHSDIDRGFVDAASYPDEVIRTKDHSHKFSPWHYVDWDVDQPNAPTADCKPDCILNELPKQIQIIKTKKSTEARALAITWVIHLVGDLHQPLHVADKKLNGASDHGGNEFEVTYLGRATCRESNSSNDKAKVELHSAWDDCLVFTLEDGRDRLELADEIRGNLTTYKNHPAASGTIADWALETHNFAKSTAYGDLQSGDDIDDDYIEKALPVVQSQLLKAGVRLAKILDENF